MDLLPIASVPELDTSIFKNAAARVQALVNQQLKSLEHHELSWVLVPTNEPRKWQLRSQSVRDERIGREVVRAFFGPGLIVWRGSQVSPDLKTLSRAVEIEIVGKSNEFLNQLELMLSVHQGKPALTRTSARPLADLLKDFYLATRTSGGRQQITDAYRLVIATGLLSPENSRFLKVEMLAACGDWNEIAGLEWFRTLTRSDMPSAIRSRLLETVWRTNFDDFEVASNPDLALTILNERSLASDSNFGTLLRSTDRANNRPGRQALVICARADEDVDRCLRIISEAPDAEKPHLYALAGLPPTDSPPKTTQTLRDSSELQTMMQDGRYDSVISAVLDAGTINADEAELLFRAAFSLKDPVRSREVIEATAHLDRSVLPQDDLFGIAYDNVLSVADGFCDGWGNWLAKSCDSLWPEAFQSIDELSDSWPVDEFLSSEKSAEFADRLIEAFDFDAPLVNPNQNALRQATGHLCSLAESLLEIPPAQPVVDAVLMVLAFDPNPSTATRTAYLSLLERILGSGPPEDRYRTVLETGASVWGQSRGSANINWLVDFVEILIAHSCPDSEARLQRIIEAARDLQIFADHVGAETRKLFDQICGEVDGLGGDLVAWPETSVEGSESTADVWGALNNKTIRLYSLMPNLGARLEKRLSHFAPDVNVQQRSDKVGDDGLRSWALSADYLVVDWRHASHSATGALDAVDRDSQILPRGGGVSSFISAILAHLEKGEGG